MPDRPLALIFEGLVATNTVASCLTAAQAHGLERIDGQLLLLHALKKPDAGRAWLLTHDDAAVPPDTAASFDLLCTRRAAGEPVAYLTGRKSFYGLDLQVDARVLDPRPDTETLVDWALELLAGQASPRVLDLGTGSGAIALALAHAKPDALVTAVDFSADALAVAQANARRLQLNVNFAQSDWLDNVTGTFDLIVSNPPYIAEGDPHLPTLHHEPRAALVAGSDGLVDLRSIVAQAPRYVAPGGWLLLEHGWDQSDAVQSVLRARSFVEVQGRNDLSGTGRCSGGQWSSVK